jgi:hypothetical protein
MLLRVLDHDFYLVVIQYTPPFIISIKCNHTAEFIHTVFMLSVILRIRVSTHEKIDRDPYGIFNARRLPA